MGDVYVQFNNNPVCSGGRYNCDSTVPFSIIINKTDTPVCVGLCTVDLQMYLAYVAMYIYATHEIIYMYTLSNMYEIILLDFSISHFSSIKIYIMSGAFMKRMLEQNTYIVITSIW